MSADRVIARIAASQHGVFTHAQAARVGFTRSMICRRVASGRWERLYRGVHRLAGAPATWRQEVIAACLSAPGRAYASHETAAALWRLDGFEPGPVELIIPRGLHLSVVRARVHEMGPLEPADTGIVDAVPLTSVARTLIDLAGVVDIARLEQALDDTLRRGAVSLARLRRRFEELARSGRPGVRGMRTLLEVRATPRPIPGSVLESRLRRLLLRARLPAPVAQYRVMDGGHLVARVDFAYPRALVAIEVDSCRHHTAPADLQSDRARQNELQRLGWLVLRFTYRDLRDDPDGVCAVVADTLALRGHSRGAYAS